MANKRIKKERPVLQTEILVRPLHRGINDIGSWRSAIRMADMDNRSKLYNLYTDLLIDGYLSDAIDKRIDAVTDADLVFTLPSGKEDDSVNLLMNTPEFEDLLREIMLSRFWGVSVVECSLQDGELHIYSVPRTHIRPAIKQIARREEDRTGIGYEGVNSIIQFGKDDDYGIILRACPYVIYKRGGFGDWAQFTELFGMPQRIGKYSSMDEGSRRELIRAFETAGSAPYMVVPKETEVTQTVLSGGTNGALYNDFRKACNEEILITVLGQTMTTQDGSSLAQGKVHLEVQEKKHKSDRRYTERMLNRYFVPWLVSRGFPVGGGTFHFRDKAKELSVDDVVKIVNMIDVPAAWVHETYNIPIAEEGEIVARGDVAREVIDVEHEDVKGEVKNSDGLIGRLRDFFVSAPLPGGAGGGGLPMRLNGEDSLEGRLIQQIAQEKGKVYFSAELFRFISGELLRAIREGYAGGEVVRMTDMEFVYGASDEAYLTAMEQNIFHFSAAKTLAEIQALNRLFRESKSFGEFYERASQTADVFNKTWQQTEYDTALLTAEAASTYKRLTGKTRLFPYWEYRTAGDSKVREEHRRLNGIILPANDPLWDKIYPPNGWKCRCYVSPRMKHEGTGIDFDATRATVGEYFKTKEWKSGQAQGWGVNRAKEAEIFTANQMYIRKFPNQAAKLLDRVTPADWGIKESFSSLVKEASVPISPYEGTASEWWESNARVTDGDEALEVTDYSGRTLRMERKGFDAHTTNTNKNRLFRTEYLNCIRQIASDPHEVWLGRDRNAKSNKKNLLDNFIMIRYYKDAALAVVAKIEGGNLVLKSWYELRDKNVRNGLLLKHSRPE
jgi:SPP1 gp7 family putative phage head morphogenesis protein